MRYPLWAFLFVFLLPPFTLHSALADNAGSDPCLAPGERFETAFFPEIDPVPLLRHAF